MREDFSDEQAFNESFVISAELSKTISYTRTLTDDISLTDDWITTTSQDLEDSISISAEISKDLTLAKTLTDSIDVSHELSSTSTLTKTLTDGIDLSTDFSSSGTVEKTLENALQSYAQVDVKVDFVRTLNDSINLSDSHIFTIARELTNDISLVDQVIRYTALVLADAVDVSGDLATVLALVLSLTDDIVIDDQIGLVYSLTRTLTDDIDIAAELQQLSAGTKDLAASVQISAELSTTLVWVRTLTEDISVAAQYKDSTTETLMEYLYAHDDMDMTFSVSKTLSENIIIDDIKQTAGRESYIYEETIPIGRDICERIWSLTRTYNEGGGATFHVSG